MFKGEYRHSLDAKNRIIIPTKIREGLGDTFVVTKGHDECLTIYTSQEWAKEEEKLSRLPITSANARKYIRFITSGAIDCSFDGQGRIQLSQPLVNYAHLSKDCVIIGMANYVEIWDAGRWDQYLAGTSEDIDSISESLTEYWQ